MCIGIFINDCICLIKKIIIRSVFEKKIVFFFVLYFLVILKVNFLKMIVFICMYR